MTIQIYLARHASPDWTRTDIPYDRPPGPPLTAEGEAEARELGTFLASRNVAHIYASPLERAHRTARLAAEPLGIRPTIEHAVAEWRKDETAEMVAERLVPFWDRVALESVTRGPLCLVTHGGPLGLILHRLGLPKAELERYTKRFDTPAPPAGLWHATSRDSGASWALELVFMPRNATR